jgi:hypothetical protein
MKHGPKQIDDCFTLILYKSVRYLDLNSHRNLFSYIN